MEYTLQRLDVFFVSFGEKLTKRMEELGISAYKLSKATGISQTIIGYYKTGKNTPTVDKATIIADYLDVSVDYLLGNTDAKKEKPDITNDAGLSHDKIDLINDIKKLDPENIKAVRAALDLFISKENL